MFYRKIEPYINDYLTGDDERILCINGARQVGKTYIVRKLAQKHFLNYIELNMAEDSIGDKLFANVNTIDQFYLQVSILHGNKMDTRENTIIFIDEIQIYPHLLTLLKPLRTDNKYKFICSGSLLGVALAKTTLIPMGSIIEKTMYPLDFEEFLLANSVGKLAINHLKTNFLNKTALDDALHNKMLNFFKYYLIVGGLPDAVKEYVNTKNIQRIRQVHKDTMNYYIQDATKYDSENKLKIARIYELQASFIDNKVNRIRYNAIENIKDSRFVKYLDEFDYLISSGISLAINAVSEPKFPLITSSKKNLLKLYYNDIGILTYISFKENINAILDNKSRVNLGAIYETVVAQELKAHNHDLYYYDRRKIGEIDFLINDYINSSVTPIEIKSGAPEYSYRALPKIIHNQNYNIKYGYIFSNNKNVAVEKNIIKMPIYYIMFI